MLILERLQQRITTLTKRRVGRDLLRLEIDGQLGLDDHQQLEQTLSQLRTRLLHLRVRGQCHRRPEAAELSTLLDRSDAPLMGSIARQLQQTLDQTSQDQHDQVALLETALCELHRLTVDAQSPCDKEMAA